MFSCDAEFRPHTSSAGRGGMLTHGLVKKAILSLHTNKAKHYILEKIIE